MSGLMWFDNSDSPIEEKLKKASTYFIEKHNTPPLFCLVNPSCLSQQKVINGITVRPFRSILPGHFWISAKDPLTITWTSLTGKFEQKEIEQLQALWEQDTNILVRNLLVFEPLVSLRAVMEIMFNIGYIKNNQKFEHLVINEALLKHWAKFPINKDTNNIDRGYARTLLILLGKISMELLQNQAHEISNNLS